MGWFMRPAETTEMIYTRGISSLFAMRKRFPINGFIVIAAFVFSLYFSAHTQAATALQSVVDECKKRTGFSDVTCTILAKKNMNLASCKKYTDFSDEECTKKIEEIKRDPGYSSGSSGATPTPSTPSPSTNPSVTHRTPADSRAEQ